MLATWGSGSGKNAKSLSAAVLAMRRASPTAADEAVKKAMHNMIATDSRVKNMRLLADRSRFDAAWSSNFD